ncbi:hypothetical protein [Burkholderia pseudomallei]|uniref:hypothetical protein n=1 Tax=Burkholderia pseudomallei TaxID=28450 RepID=UPI001178869F|nr:hypothetical protein [Burkholderia pseudomallei]
MILTTSSARRVFAQVIALASPVCGLYLLWLIVPFCRGQITSPLVAAYNYIGPFGMKLNGAWDAALNDANSGFTGFLFYYLIGIAGFTSAAGIVLAMSEAASRVLLVGWKKFKEEQREALKAEQAAARVEAARERRRERRLGVMQSKNGNSDSCWWIAMVGAAFFVWFL